MPYLEDGDEKGGERHALQLERLKGIMCTKGSVLVNVCSTKNQNTESVTFSRQAGLLRRG